MRTKPRRTCRTSIRSRVVESHAGEPGRDQGTRCSHLQQAWQRRGRPLSGAVMQTSGAGPVHDTPNARMRSVVRLTRSQALLTTWSCSAGVCAAT